MRWPAFAVLAYGMLALQVGLAPGLAIETAGGFVLPVFSLILAVFVGLWGPPQTVLIAFGVLGAMMDLTTGWPLAAGPEAPVTQQATFLGPYTLGFLAAGFLILRTRAMMLSRHPLTLGAMVLLSGALMQAVVIAVLLLRSLYDQPPLAWALGDEVVTRLLSLLYTALVGTALAIPLSYTRGFLGLETPAGAAGW